MRGIFVVGLLGAGYIVAFVLLQPRIGDGVMALTTIPIVAAGTLYGLRVGTLGGVIAVAINIFLMQTIGNHDGFRLPQIPRIAVAIGLGAAAGWASDSVRRHRALLADNRAKAAALRELMTDLEGQVAERTADLTTANASLATQLEHRKRVEASAAAAGRMAVVGTLAAGIGHEINNPLAAIIANLDVTLEQLVDAPPTIREALQDARLAADRVAEIVRNLRGLIESKSDHPTADVPRVVKSTLQMVSNQLQGRARIDLDLADTASVAISESRLGQILLNLLTNAAHAMPAGGGHELRIEARPCASRSRVRIRVSDTGTGIAPDERAHIFEPFFTTKPVGTGAGLGLWVCHQLVTAANGSIELESSNTSGTTFRIELPSARPLGTPNLARPLDHRRGRLLVIDDDDAIRRAIKRCLRAHDLVIVETAEAGLALIENGEEFDAILCDVMMPECDGPEFFDRLSTENPTQAENVIFMTGGAFTSRITEFLGATEHRLVEKPFDVLELEGAIQEVLDRDAST